jgi:formate/nitrite transporter FocA (FNT family)
MQAKTDSIAGKALCVIMAISTFAAIGLEHSVVNMTILTLCLFLDGEVFTIGNYFRNILLSALGNMVGGIVTMTLPAYYTLWLQEQSELDGEPAPLPTDQTALVHRLGDHAEDETHPPDHF